VNSNSSGGGSSNYDVNVNVEGEEKVNKLTQALSSFWGIMARVEADAKKFGGSVAEGLALPSSFVESFGKQWGETFSAGALGKKVAESFGDLPAKALGGIINVAGQAGQALLKMSQDAMETAVKIGTISERTGVAAEDLSVLKDAAEQNGSSLETVGGAFDELATKIHDAVNHNGDAIDSFKSVGVSMEDLQTKSPRDIFLEVANGLEGIKDPAMRAAEAHNVLGGSSVALQGTLHALAGDGFNKLSAEAKNFGTVVSGDTARSALEFEKTIAKVKESLAGGAMMMVSAVMPALNALTETIESSGEDGWLKYLNPLRLVGMALQGIIGIFTITVSAVQAAGSQLGIVFDGFGRAADALLHGRFGELGGIVKDMFKDMGAQVSKDWDAMVAKLEKSFPQPGKAETAHRDPDAHDKKRQEEASQAAANVANNLQTINNYHTQNTEQLQKQVNLTNQVGNNYETHAETLNTINGQATTLTASVQAWGRQIIGSNNAVTQSIKGDISETTDASKTGIAQTTNNASTGINTVFKTANTGIQASADVVTKSYTKLVGDVTNSTKTLIKDFFDVALNGGSVEQAFKKWAKSVSSALSDALAEQFSNWLKNLQTNATTHKDANGNIVQASTSAKVGYAALEGAGAAFSIYSNAAAGGSRTAGTIAGGITGAEIGTSIAPGIGTAIGAVVGVIVGAIAAGLGAAAKRDEYKYGIPGIDKHGDVSFTMPKNMEAAEIKSWIAKINDQYQTFWNDYVNILIKLPGSSVPAPQGINGQFQPNPSGHYMEHLQQWLDGTLPDDIAKQFKAAMEDAFSRSGVRPEAFDKFWAEADQMDPKKAVQFWSDLSEGLAAFDRADRTRQNINSMGEFNVLSNFDKNGDQRSGSAFTSDLRSQTQGIFDVARQMVTLTGPEKVQAWKQLGQTVQGVMNSLTEYLNRVASTIKAVQQTFADAMLEHKLAQFHEVRNDKGEVVQTEDKVGEANLLKEEVNKLYSQIQNAVQLGLTPEDVQAASQKALGLLERIYALDPSDEMNKWWMDEAGKLESVTTSELSKMGDEARSAVDKLMTELEPFKAWFLGLEPSVTALQQALQRTGDAFPGFAQALSDLITRIQIDAPPKTKPDPDPDPIGGIPPVEKPKKPIFKIAPDSTSDPMSTVSASELAASSVGHVASASILATSKAAGNVVSIAAYLENAQWQSEVEKLKQQAENIKKRMDELQANPPADSGGRRRAVGPDGVETASGDIHVVVNVNGATVGVDELQSNVTRAAMAGVVTAIRNNPTIIEHPFALGA
jgi:hypothetical protein